MNLVDTYQYIFTAWLVCLLGLILALPLSIRLPIGDFRPVLHRNGIYEPKYSMTLLVAMLLGDLALKLAICTRFKKGDLDTDMIVTAEIFASFFLFGILWFMSSKMMPRIGNRSIRKVSSQTDYHKMAIQMSAVSSGYVICSYLIQRFFSGYWYGNSKDSILSTIAIVLLAALIIWKIYLHINRYDTIKDEAERTLAAIKTKHPPIIFLRSFELDKHVLKGKSFDEYICNNFSQHSQPIISLSDPDDYLPTGGSIKLQSFDTHWQEAILQLMEICRAVVIFEGRTKSLSWEISKIPQTVLPEKLFVATPPQSYRKAAWFRGQGNSQLKYTMNYMWSHFTNELQKAGIQLAQKEDPGADTIFSFDNQWRSKAPVRAKGMKFFDTILENTTQYEDLTCNYAEVSEKLRKFELTRTLTCEESNKIRSASYRVLTSFFLVTVVTAITIFIL